mgnify:CR=1 FL=1
MRLSSVAVTADSVFMRLTSGLSVSRPSTARFFRLALLVPLGLPVAVAQRVLKRWLLVRICRVRSDRLGHFIGESDLRISRELTTDSQNFSRNEHVLHFFDSVPINTVMADSLRKRFRFGPKFLLEGAYWINRALGANSPWLTDWPTIPGMPDLSVLNRDTQWFRFTPNQKIAGRRILSELGIGLGDRYVCLFPRDAAYGTQVASEVLERSQKYRNCALETFDPAVKRMQELGLKVVLMGRSVTDRSDVKIDGVIDYRSSDQVGDLADLMLAANCDFALACDTGSAFLPILFRKRLAIVNTLSPWGLFQGTAVSVCTMKTWRRSDGSSLSLKELLFEGQSFGPMGPDSDFFDSLGLTCVDCSPEEILDVVEEMLSLKVSAHETVFEDLRGDLVSNQAANLLALRKPGNWQVPFSPSWLSRRPHFLA